VRKNKIYNNTLSDITRDTHIEDGTSCDKCGNPIEACMCTCPYCGELDACECCLYDAATGGG
jgi:hypothetical protein